MRARLATLVVLACAVGIGIATNALIAHAAPALQLPWPTGQQHRISGGNTYGCDFHTDSSYYAIDFQLAQGNDVSAVANPNRLRQRFFSSAQGWSNWENLATPSGVTLNSDPAAVSWGYRRIDVFIRGSDGRLWHRWY